MSCNDKNIICTSENFNYFSLYNRDMIFYKKKYFKRLSVQYLFSYFTHNIEKTHLLCKIFYDF